MSMFPGDMSSRLRAYETGVGPRPEILDRFNNMQYPGPGGGQVYDRGRWDRRPMPPRKPPMRDRFSPGNKGGRSPGQHPPWRSPRPPMFPPRQQPMPPMRQNPYSPSPFYQRRGFDPYAPMMPQGQGFGGSLGQVIPTNIPFRDPGYGSPVRTQNLIQSLSGPNSLMDPYRGQQSMGMLDRFRPRPDASMPYPMPSPYPEYPSPYPEYPSPYPSPYPRPGSPGKGGRQPGGRQPGGPGKGGRMPPDDGRVFPNPGLPYPGGGGFPPGGDPRFPDLGNWEGHPFPGGEPRFPQLPDETGIGITPQVITVGLDGKEYPNPAAADAANQQYLAEQEKINQQPAIDPREDTGAFNFTTPQEWGAQMSPGTYTRDIWMNTDAFIVKKPDGSLARVWSQDELNAALGPVQQEGILSGKDFSKREDAGGNVATSGNPFDMPSVGEDDEIRNVLVDDGSGNQGRINVNWDNLSEQQRSDLVAIAQANPDLNERAKAAYQYMADTFGISQGRGRGRMAGGGLASLMRRR